MQNFLITGANRGIGLAITKKILQIDSRIIATYRSLSASKELVELSEANPGRLMLVELDVTSEASLQKFSDKINESIDSFDVLINNAGFLAEYGAPLTELSFEKLEEMIQINTFGPMRTIKAVLSCLSKSQKPIIANISSKVGSIADNTSGGAYGYRMSKTALNMFNKSFSIEQPNIISVVLHPGWVQTSMGGDNAPTTTEESAEGLLSVISKLTLNDTGKFFDFQGEPLPW